MTTSNELTSIQGALAELLKQGKGSRQEGQLLELLRPLPPESFAEVVQGVDIARLLKTLDRRLWGTTPHGAEFLGLLERAMPHLDLPSKIVTALTLADGPTSFREEKALRALFLSETGLALTELKLGIDAADSGHDLLDILTSDIDAPELRFDIIKHFQTSAVRPKDPKQRPLRVVSDIDDTLYSALNDPRHPRGTLYQGVLELFASLSEYPPVFLTARPELASSLLERLTHVQLRRYGLEKPTVLSGSLKGLFGHRRMAEQKERTLMSYTEMYPEFRFIFFGDSGQGDIALAESLLRQEEAPIERAFIHKLSDSHEQRLPKHSRIHVFSDYAQASQQLGALGYLQPTSLSSEASKSGFAS